MHSALDEQAVGTPRRTPTRSRRRGGASTTGAADSPRVLIRLPDLRSAEVQRTEESEIQHFDIASDQSGPHYQHFNRSTTPSRSRVSLSEHVQRLAERVKWAIRIARWIRRPSAVTAAIMAMAAQLAAFLGYLYWAATGAAPATNSSPETPSALAAPRVQLTEPTLAPPKPAAGAPALPNMPSTTPRLGDPRDLPPWESWSPPQELPSPAPSSNSSTQNHGPAASVAARSTFQASDAPPATMPRDVKPGAKPQAAARLSGEIKKLPVDPSHEHARPGLY